MWPHRLRMVNDDMPTFNKMIINHHPMDKVLYKKVCLGIVLLLLSGEFTAQTLKYVDAQKLLMVGKAQPNTEYYHRIDTALYIDLPP